MSDDVWYWKLNGLVPGTSPGIRSGVNWMRPKLMAEGRRKRLRQERLAGTGRAFSSRICQPTQQAGQHEIDDVILTDRALRTRREWPRSGREMSRTSINDLLFPAENVARQRRRRHV